MPEKIPCPVPGCDEEFDDEASAIAHMKAEHRDHFSSPESVPVPPVTEKEETEVMTVPDMAMLVKLVDQRIDARVQAAIEAERPQVAAAVKGAIEQVLATAQAQGFTVPGVTGNSADGGVVPGSPVTPTGAAFINFLMKQGGGASSDMENLAKTLTQARAISDVLNPPSIWDRVMQNVVLRSLRGAGLVTEGEMKELIVLPAKS